MKSCWYLLLIGAGIGLIIISFIYNLAFAGIPYQDPPPHLAARYAFHAAVANALFWAGSAVVLLGVIIGVLSFALRMRR
jgi:hypothetical protein